MFFVFFFFKQKTAYEMRISDWSSDVCSSDLMGPETDPTAVVDDHLRVRGIEALRVVDASIMPTMLSSNLNASVMMIADKAGHDPRPAGAGGGADPRLNRIAGTRVCQLNACAAGGHAACREGEPDVRPDDGQENSCVTWYARSRRARSSWRLSGARWPPT